MADGRPARVLLCDDVEELRALVRDALEEGGELVVAGEAGDGDGALGCAVEIEPDIIVLDLNMPGPAPHALLSAISRLAPRAMLVSYSGREPGDVVGDAASLLALHVPKTMALAEMRERLVAIWGQTRTESAPNA